jgi:signal transduction histidine kinase
MFMSVKRHERESQAVVAAHTRLTDLLLKHMAQGMFLIDAADKIQPPMSQSAAGLFRQRDLTNISFAKLLQPIVSERTLIALCAELAQWREALAQPDAPPTTLHRDLDVRLPKSDGAFDTGHFTFDFHPADLPGQPGACVVWVTDQSQVVQQARELDDAQAQLTAQGAILRAILRMGRARFAATLQRTDESMTAIHAILKKPAREQAAFRNKLEETLDEVSRIRREGSTMQIVSLEAAARRFEDSLHELRGRNTLSGSDFLPLAVQLDELFSELALLQSLTNTATATTAMPADAPNVPMTQNGTQILEAPKFLAQMAEAPPMQSAEPAAPVELPRAAPAGSLEHTLTSLAEHIALEQHKSVTLHCRGLHKIPAPYLRPVKNVAIQLIRNAIIHGIEPAEVREAAGKPAAGLLHILFIALPDGTYELRFQDDGYGLDAEQIRAVAVAKDLVSAEAAAAMRDRQAIKLIFKAGYTTLADSGSDMQRGAGLALVRRYVSDAGGKIALASHLGSETRFRVTLPPLKRKEEEQRPATGEESAPVSADPAAAPDGGGPDAVDDAEKVA